MLVGGPIIYYKRTFNKKKKKKKLERFFHCSCKKKKKKLVEENNRLKKRVEFNRCSLKATPRSFVRRECSHGSGASIRDNGDRPLPTRAPFYPRFLERNELAWRRREPRSIHPSISVDLDIASVRHLEPSGCSSSIHVFTKGKSNYFSWD